MWVGGGQHRLSSFFFLFSNSCWQRRFILLQCFECIIYVGIDVLYTQRKQKKNEGKKERKPLHHKKALEEML